MFGMARLGLWEERLEELAHLANPPMETGSLNDESITLPRPKSSRRNCHAAKYGARPKIACQKKCKAGAKVPAR
jgi:hypothetical protein